MGNLAANPLRQTKSGAGIDVAFCAFLEDAPLGICILDSSEKLLYANVALGRMLGASQQELCGAHWADLASPGERNFAGNDANNPLGGRAGLSAADGNQDTERSLLRRDGGVVWARIRFAAVKGGPGDPLSTIVYVEDETERSRLHAALRESEDRFRKMADGCPSMMWVTDSRGEVQFVNQAYRRFCGIENEERDRRRWERLLHPVEAQEYAASLDLALAERNAFKAEARIEIASGDWRIIGSTAEPCISSRGEYLGHVGLSADITERKRMEEALREAEQRYRGIFDKAIVGIFQSSPEGRFINVNPAMASILGYGLPQEMMDAGAELAQGFFVEVAQGLKFMEAMNQVGGVRDFECEVLQRDSNKIWLTMNIRAINEQGAVVRYEGMCEDITERKQLRTQLLHAQKLESVGQLAAGIAHEINTPTQYIGDNVRFLQDAFHGLKSLWEKYQGLTQAAQTDERHAGILADIAATAENVDAAYLIDEIPRAIDQALEGVNRVSTLVSAMKEFSHPGTKEKIPVDLNHAIESTITVSRNEWKYVADLEVDFDESLERVMVLPGEFNQVILNLIVNAAHAIADANRSNGLEKGRIRVQTRKLPAAAEIRIADSGTGVPEKIRNRIFDPFFTTKEIGKGTGQGLAIAHSVVVDKHGGTIRFESEEGKGTTFIICLPHEGGNPR